MDRPAAPRHVAVIDIGKTNAKIALVDMASLSEVAVRKTPNTVVSDGLYPHYDCDRLWRFILDGLRDFQSQIGVNAISVTTHGVAAALLDAGGRLAMPVLDYEFDGPETLAAEYDAVRPPFAETGTPRLPVGLNLGAQLFWQARAFPAAFERAASIVTYPQYWAYRLCGVAANEATSLGCHTDLWEPSRGRFSSLVSDMNWLEKMAPVRKAGERLAPIRPELASETGIAPDVGVWCGIHDSNASLYPHLLRRKAPFAVVSTGTWVIAMAVGGAAKTLDPARDCLVNVDALGNPVNSARFMGGREHALATEGLTEGFSQADVEAVLEGIFLLPSVQQGSGPFPQRSARWVGEPGDGQKRVAVAFYLAMMTATCLDLVGAGGEVIVEGPFAANTLFADMLAAATGRGVVADPSMATGTSVGAALLAAPGFDGFVADAKLRENREPRWQAYAARWKALAG